MNSKGTAPAAASDHPGPLAWLRRHLPTLIAGTAFAVVAGVTGRVSYLHIEALSLALHQPPDIARIMPFGVDGLIVVGSVALLQAPADQGWLGWICIGPGTAASLFANVESGWKYGPLSAGWAGMASLGFFVATFTLERWLKSQAEAPDHAAPAVPPQPVPEAVPASAAPAENAQPGPPALVTPEDFLLGLINSQPHRETAAMIGISKTTVGRWKARLSQGGTISPELSQDGPEEAPPFSDVPRLPRLAELAEANGSGPHA